MSEQTKEQLEARIKRLEAELNELAPYWLGRCAKLEAKLKRLEKKETAH